MYKAKERAMNKQSVKVNRHITRKDEYKRSHGFSLMFGVCMLLMRNLNRDFKYHVGKFGARPHDDFKWLTV